MTFDINLVPDGGISWLDASGPDGNIVLSTRVRLARNLNDQPFTVRSGPEDNQVVLDQVERASRASRQLHDAPLIRIDHLSGNERQLLHERHLISRELAELGDDGRVRTAAALLTDGCVGMMVNEEDHVRLQCLKSGFSLEEAYSDLERLDADIGAQLGFAFHEEFGYLTSCPTNAGTGLRA
ncbi:MAG: ATP--guanido phosphotransferase, partial [Gemmatimonadales bacterium]